ncbi:hypothetical protein F4778DRAFT_785933 [Xylariomycetidae sp. FL2044]|nr:hypothetical protein F4778DRAFT_785933 [Xylariomycetidae sp. FL2044]
MKAQRALIRQSYARAGLDISSTAYVEAHMRAQLVSGAAIVGIADAAQVVVEVLMSEMAEIFNKVTTDIDQALLMSYYGMNSLVSVELRN